MLGRRLVGVESFISSASKIPYPQHPQQVPSRSPQLRATGLSIFTLLAASPINSQKLPNSSFESLQLPRLAIFSSSPQLL